MAEIFTITVKGSEPRRWVLEQDLDAATAEGIRDFFDQADDRRNDIAINSVGPGGSWRMRLLDATAEALAAHLDPPLARALRNGAAAEFALTRSLGPLTWTWRIPVGRSPLERGGG